MEEWTTSWEREKKKSRQEWETALRQTCHTPVSLTQTGNITFSCFLLFLQISLFPFYILVISFILFLSWKLGTVTDIHRNPSGSFWIVFLRLWKCCYSIMHDFRHNLPLDFPTCISNSISLRVLTVLFISLCIRVEPSHSPTHLRSSGSHADAHEHACK